MNFQPEFFTYMMGFFAEPELGSFLDFTERFDFVSIDNDSDFELKRLVMFQDRGGVPTQTEATRCIPNFNFNIRDDATGRTLFNGFASTGEIFGDGRIPFVLPTSHFFQRGGKAQMLYDPTAPGPDFGSGIVWLGLVGAKHFEKG